MKIFLIIFVVFFMSLQAEPIHSNTIDSQAIFDEKHQVYIFTRDDYQIVWYKNKNKKAEGGLKNSQRNGRWKFWYEDGTLKAEGDFLNHKMNGYWKYYYKNGNLEKEGNYTNNKKEGVWKFYYPNGKVKSIGTFKGGLKNGKWEEYYETGQLFFKGNYKTDMADGFWIYYFPDGSFYQSGNFEFDVRVGEWKVCISPNGQCGIEINDNKKAPPISNLPKIKDSQEPFSNDLDSPSKVWDSMEK
ncbi:MAG: toxin-antitoxin system YwqK family antitoxin [Leptonema sp. (in: bacteria)]